LFREHSCSGDTSRVRLQKLQSISRKLPGDKLQTVVAYHTSTICLYGMVTIAISGLFDAGRRRDRPPNLATYHRFTVHVIGCKSCGVCRF
jgi:hypothetical protein